uniref:helix-turn-helix domain-containing protein n=1 Tax=Pararhizobium sp. IMCC3301 TaxID=3067904 RepID=UPI0027421241|nr:helix-turn-helix domain-containing protein [Pararhizobium sp. IMCC3301]
MAKNFVRIFKLTESLSDAPQHGLSRSEIVQRSGLPTSTVYRLLTEMEQAGYVYTTAEGRLLPNFSFERRIRLGNVTPEQLRQACSSVSRQLQSASEIILHRGHNLLWHITDEQSSQAIKLRAHPGYVRATYELDSMSRLVLAHCDIAEIEKTWDLSAFYDVGVQGNRVAWENARQKILNTDKDEMQFDIQGNAKGVRRYCVAVTDPDGAFVCLLTAAEAATPLKDEKAHIKRIRETLLRAKAALEEQQNNTEEGAFLRANART